MNSKVRLLILLALAIWGKTSAQCGNTLVEQAIAGLSRNALFVREFKVKFKEGNTKNPVPSGKFTAYLRENSHYQFSVMDAAEFEGKGILQLFDNTNLLGSTFDPETKADNHGFDFSCTKSAYYQIVMSFIDGKAGCAVGLLSVIMPDSLADRSDSAKSGEHPTQALYLGVENPLSISVDTDPGDKISYHINQGEIIQRNDSAFARVEREGIAVVTIQIYGPDGQLKEEGSAEFAVTLLPPPYVTLVTAQGLAGDIFNMTSYPVLYLQLPQEYVKLGYKVIEFYIFPGDNSGSTINDFLSGRKHSGNVLRKNDLEKVLMNPLDKPNQSNDFPRSTIVGYSQRFSITNIKIRDGDGKTYMAPDIVFQAHL